MSRPENPRFPHTCVIYRHSEVSPLVDEDVNYDPLADEEEEETTTEEVVEEEVTEETDEVTTIYEGECRVYEKNTTSDRGEIITSTRGLALPLTLDDWSSLGVCPREGDEIKVQRGNVTEYGTVIDKNPNTFGGTHLIWRYGRN